MANKKETEEEKFTILVNDGASFWPEFKAFRENNRILEKHISSAMTLVPNPNYAPGVIIPGAKPQPEVVTMVYVSAVIFYHEGKEPKK